MPSSIWVRFFLSLCRSHVKPGKLNPSTLGHEIATGRPIAIKKVGREFCWRVLHELMLLGCARSDQSGPVQGWA